MLRVKFNDQETQLQQPCNLGDVLQDQGFHEGPYAVVVNGTFVRREQRDEILLQDGDEVTILAPMSGG
jgi:thiamine biosynthesis protein ThiS